MAGYDSTTTGEEVAQAYKSYIANKTILITGASPNGLGASFAAIIAKHNPACIILATRDVSAAGVTARDIAVVAPSLRCVCIELDLGSIAHVRRAAEEINLLDVTIDIIVNNAGIMATPYGKTVDGIERQFGINFVGHFLLTNLLLPKILARNEPIRIVNVSSSGYRWSPVRFEDTDFDDGKTYRPFVSYAQSKSANMLFSVSLALKLGKQNLTSVSLHPGVSMTNLGRYLKPEEFAVFGQLDREFGYKRHWDEATVFKTLSQAAATHVFAAFHPDLGSAGLNGSFLEDSAVVSPEDVVCWARDPVDAERLWKLGEELVGQEFTF